MNVPLRLEPKALPEPIPSKGGIWMGIKSFGIAVPGGISLCAGTPAMVCHIRHKHKKESEKTWESPVFAASDDTKNKSFSQDL